MPIIRTLFFAALVYVLSSLLFLGAVSIMPGDFSTPPLASFVVYWVGTVLILLSAAKWYFKRVVPTTKHGFLFGCSIVVFSLVIDVLLMLGAYFAGSSLDMVRSFYTGWELYLSFLIVIATTTYAGFEFDSTYSGGPQNQK